MALVALAACGGDKAAPSPTTADADAMPYYLPAFLPFGFKVVQGRSLPQGPAQPALAVAVGKADGSGGFTDVLLVLLHAAEKDRVVPPDQQATVKEIDVNGARARLLDSGAVGTSIDWFANGMNIAVSGPIGSSTVAIDIAKRVRLGSDVAGSSVDGAPVGYEVIADNRFEDREPEQARLLSITSDSGASITISATRTQLPLVFAAAGGDRITPGKVRGRDALVAVRTRRLEGGPVTQSAIVWHERPDIVVAVIGNTAADTLRPIAEGMATVTEADWQAVVQPQARS